MSAQLFVSTLSQVITTQQKAAAEHALVLLLQQENALTGSTIPTILEDTAYSTTELIQELYTVNSDTAVLRQYYQFLTQLPVATITLSYLPTVKQVQTLSKLLRKKLDAHLILDVQFDSSVGLGFSLDVNGKTFAKHIDVVTL